MISTLDSKLVINVYHRCGHTNSHVIIVGMTSPKGPQVDALRAQDCRKCQAGIPVAPKPEPVVEQPAPVAHTHRRDSNTFICSGCGMEWPRELAMSASLGISCPDCYDKLSDRY